LSHIKKTKTYDEGYDECGRLIRLIKEQRKASHYEAKTKSTQQSRID